MKGQGRVKEKQWRLSEGQWKGQGRVKEKQWRLSEGQWKGQCIATGWGEGGEILIVESQRKAAERQWNRNERQRKGSGSSREGSGRAKATGWGEGGEVRPIHSCRSTPRARYSITASSCPEGHNSRCLGQAVWIVVHVCCMDCETEGALHHRVLMPMTQPCGDWGHFKCDVAHFQID